MAGWIVENWFNLLSSVGIISSPLFTAVSLRSETKTRRVSNLLTLTQNHRELWAEMFQRPGLERVLDPSADVSASGLSLDEQFYVTMAIHHLHSAYQAVKSGLVVNPKGIREDVRVFFSLPIPQAAWRKIRDLQNDDFVEFIEMCRKPKEIR